MCNPPFFDSLAEAGRNPRTSFGGSHEEMVTPGGELAFVRQMVLDSLQLKVRTPKFLVSLDLVAAGCLSA